MSRREAGRKKESKAGIPYSEEGKEAREVGTEEDEREDSEGETVETNADAGEDCLEDEMGEVLNDGGVGLRVREAGRSMLRRKGRRAGPEKDGRVVAASAGEGGSVAKKWAGMDSVS